ncbi:MAG: S41 family peptidase [Candidatus Omnitrophica bacterium]|nr:S41 family peptidase [Candidatus Omnitrophota bacterium]
MGKKFIIVIATIVSFLSITTLAISQMDRKTKDDLYSQIELYSYTLTTIQADYVEEIPPKDLIYGSLKGMLSTLDPHSQFLDPDEYKELKTETQGKFGGLGIEISIRDGLLTIISPIEDTPAWNAGIKAGDRIVKIEDKLTKDITLGDAVKLLRGKPGTEIRITILRESEFKIEEFKLTREIIHIQDVKNVQVLKDNIGYIRLTEFREDSATEFRKGLDTLGKDGATGLILDLRNNPGGLLNVAIKITEEFLPSGTPIVSTKGRRKSQDTETFSSNNSHVVEWPMVILINEGSASGSEILAGALKDNKRAIILGTKSFGKGSVQSVIPLPDGSGLRLTTSKYYTPSGVTIHGKGIEPDIVIEKINSKEEDEEENTDGKAKKEDSKDKVEKIFDDIESKESADPEALKLSKKEQEDRERLLNDNQVISAMSVIKGIRVYKSFADRPEPVFHEIQKDKPKESEAPTTL